MLFRSLKYRVVYESPDVRRNLDTSDDDVELDSALDDLLTYNEVCEYLTRDRNSEDGEQWKYREFLNHVHTPVGHKDRKGSEYNVLVLWENGEQTYEPLSILAKDAAVDCAKYAKKKNLLNKPGWKQFKRLAKREKVIDRLIKQARLRSFCLRPKYKYGFEVPRDYRHAMQLDQRNGNTKWQKAVDTEYELVVIEYEAFIDKGKFSIEKIPDGYKLIKVHMV